MTDIASLEVLKTVPFIEEMELIGDVSEAWDGLLRLCTPEGVFLLAMKEKRGTPGLDFVARLVARPLPDGVHGKLLLAPTITSGVARALRDQGVNLLDDAGNLHLALGGRYLASIEGRKLPGKAAPRGLRSAAYRVVCALLIDPELFGSPLRSVAQACGVSTSAVLSVRSTLTEEGMVVRGRGRERLVRSELLLDRWLLGYREMLRPRLFLARFVLPSDSIAVLARILAHALPQDSWAWGGSQAALRLFSTGTSGDVILHVRKAVATSLPKLPLREDRNGGVEVLDLPCATAWSGSPQVVHPLLVLGELSVRSDDRSREVAGEIRHHLLKMWGIDDGS